MELLILLAQIIGVIVILILCIGYVLPLAIVMFILAFGALYRLIHFVYCTLARRRM